MTETSLGKLQIIVDNQAQEIIKLKDTIAKLRSENDSLKKNLKYYKDNIKDMVKKAIDKTITEIIEENTALKEENEKIKRILNNNSNNSGIPTSKTPIGQEKKNS